MHPDTPRIEDEEGSDLQAIVDRLVAKRWWIVAGVVLATALFVTAAFVMTPVYRASVLLIPASADRNSLSSTLNSALGQFGGLASLAGVSVGAGDASTEEALAVLRSRQFIDAFIADLNLLPELFADRWDPATKGWKPEAGKPPTAARAYRRFMGICKIEQDKKTNIVTLQIDWRARDKVALWANELAGHLNSEMRNRAIRQAEASVKFLETELETTSVVETRQAINRLIESQIKQRMLASVSQEYAFRVVDRAVQPDIDDPVKPKKLTLLIMGPIVGLMGSIVLVLLSGLLALVRRQRPVSSR